MNNTILTLPNGDFRVLPEDAHITEYRDPHLENPIYFWTSKSCRLSPIYSSREEAAKWNGTPIELT